MIEPSQIPDPTSWRPISNSLKIFMSQFFKPSRKLRLCGEQLERRDLLTFSPHLLGDFTLGTASSTFSDFTPVGDGLLFQVNDRELWIYDPSSIAPGEAPFATNLDTDAAFSGISFRGISYNNLTFKSADQLVFEAQTDDGPTVWVTDGSASGTFEAFTGSLIGPLVQMPGYTLFRVSDGQQTTTWRTDGSEFGTYELIDAPIDPSVDFFSLGATAYMLAVRGGNYEVWYAGTQTAHRVTYFPISSVPSNNIQLSGSGVFITDGDSVYGVPYASQGGTVQLLSSNLKSDVTVSPYGGLFLAEFGSAGIHAVRSTVGLTSTRMQLMPEGLRDPVAFGGKIGFVVGDPSPDAGLGTGSYEVTPWITDASLVGTAAVAAPLTVEWSTITPTEVGAGWIEGLGNRMFFSVTSATGQTNSQGRTARDTAWYAAGSTHDFEPLGVKGTIVDRKDDFVYFLHDLDMPEAGGDDPVLYRSNTRNAVELASVPGSDRLEWFFDDEDRLIVQKFGSQTNNRNFVEVFSKGDIRGTSFTTTSPTANLLGPYIHDEEILMVEKGSPDALHVNGAVVQSATNLEGRQWDIDLKSTSSKGAVYKLIDGEDELLVGLNLDALIQPHILPNLDTVNFDNAVADELGHYFPHSAADTGIEIWATDGTAFGPNVVDFATGPISSNPEVIEWNGRTIVMATSPATGRELWVLEPVHGPSVIDGTVFEDGAVNDDELIDQGEGREGVRISAVNSADGTTYTTATSANGLFRISVPPGDYTVTATNFYGMEESDRTMARPNVSVGEQGTQHLVFETSTSSPNRPDIMAVNSVGQLLIGISTGTQLFSFFNTGWPPDWNFTYIGSGDINGDGLDDLVGRTEDGRLEVALSLGDGTRVLANWGTWTNVVSWSDFEIGDFDGDGLDDLIARADSDGSWWLAKSTGNGFVNSYWGRFPTITDWTFVFGDFNGDGRRDVAGRAELDGTWWTGISDGTRLNNALWGRWANSVAWRDIVVGDFNSDGKDDIAGRSEYGSWWVSTSNGNRFSSKYWGTWSADVTWQDVVVGDFDGDGDDDIAGRGNGQWWIAMADPATMLFTQSYWGFWTTATTWHDVMVLDFQANGRDDLLGRAANGDWWLFNSLGSVFTGHRVDQWPTMVWQSIHQGQFVPV